MRIMNASTACLSYKKYRLRDTLTKILIQSQPLEMGMTNGMILVMINREIQVCVMYIKCFKITDFLSELESEILNSMIIDVCEFITPKVYSNHIVYTS